MSHDPTSTVCNAAGTACTRTQYPNNTIPLSKQSKTAQYLQHFLPQHYTLPTATGNNFVGGYPYGLNNWMTTDRFRLDHQFEKHHCPYLCKGTTGNRRRPRGANHGWKKRNPLRSLQLWPGVCSEDHGLDVAGDLRYLASLRQPVQLRFCAIQRRSYLQPESRRRFRCNGSSTSGLPPGQASDAFPLPRSPGNGSLPTGWAGKRCQWFSLQMPISPRTTSVDGIKQTFDHSAGVQDWWLQYNYTINSTGTSPLTLATSSTETQGFLCKTGATGSCSLANSTTNLDTKTGYSYASSPGRSHRQRDPDRQSRHRLYRRTLPPHLALYSGRLEGHPQAHPEPRSAL